MWISLYIESKTQRRMGFLVLMEALIFLRSLFLNLKEFQQRIKPYAKAQGLLASFEESERNFKAVQRLHIIAKDYQTLLGIAKFI